MNIYYLEHRLVPAFACLLITYQLIATLLIRFTYPLSSESRKYSRYVKKSTPGRLACKCAGKIELKSKVKFIFDTENIQLAQQVFAKRRVAGLEMILMPTG